MNGTVSCVIDSRCYLGEAPVWSEAAQTLYWLDIAPDSRLHAWNLASRATRNWPLGELATGLAPVDNGGLIVVSQSGLSLLDPRHERRARFAGPPFPMTDLRFNDCGCDRLGRLWTGTMRNSFQRERAHTPEAAQVGQLFCMDTDLSWHAMVSGIGCPNTFVWSLDDSILYSADSTIGHLYAYRYHLATGEIGDRMQFAAPEKLGIPDGSAVDSEGCLWNARWGAGCVARFAVDGSVLEVVPIPADLVTSCAFGGPNMETLFVTTARFGLSAADLIRQPLAGGVFAFKPEVPGWPRANFNCHSLASTQTR